MNRRAFKAAFAHAHVCASNHSHHHTNRPSSLSCRWNAFANNCPPLSLSSSYGGLSVAAVASADEDEVVSSDGAVPIPPCDTNSNDASSHGGIPIGAVQLGASHAQAFREVVDRSLLRPGGTSGDRARLRNRAVERFVGPRDRDGPRDAVLVHVPPAVASAIEGGHPSLVEFLRRAGGVYLPGVRRSRFHREATRKRRNANLRFDAEADANGTNANADSGTAGSPSATMSNEKDHPTAAPQSTFTFSELFAGIGGFRLGLESIGGRCVFANEINPYAADIYRRNFLDDDALVEADMLDLCAVRDIPADADILTGGFPCQPFSSRGKQRGLRDERGQLYREIVRVLRASHPKSFILENVSGLVSIGTGGGGRYVGRGLPKRRGEAGSVFQTILNAFEECGYDVTWNICNSRHYVAQQRERVFIIGIREDLATGSKYSWDWYDKLLLGAHKTNHDLSPIVRDIMEPPDSPAVFESELSPSQWDKLQGMYSTRNCCISGARIDINAKAPTLISSYRRTGSHTSKYIFEERDGKKRQIPRYLTPRECCRIQGFPDHFHVPSAKGDGEVATAHFYSGIGNAVVPPLVASIGKELFRCLRFT